MFKLKDDPRESVVVQSVCLKGRLRKGFSDFIDNSAFTLYLVIIILSAVGV